MNQIESVRAIRESGMIDRVHVIPYHRPYTNASHSWNVAVLCRFLWPNDPQLVDIALFHDVPERWTGDIPSPVIRRNPEIAAALRREDARICKKIGVPSEHDLNKEDFAKFKAADRLEFWLWTQEELVMGNQMVTDACEEIEKYLFEDPSTPGRVRQFMAEWKTAALNGLIRHKETI